MKLPDKIYNILKWVALICLPAIATFCGVIGKVWDLPYTAEIVTTITAMATLVGALIGVSTISYNKGSKDKPEKEGNDESK